MSIFRTATRRHVWLKLALMGTSGSGKTYSSLLLAKGIASAPDKIALLDTENGSGELYSHLYPYNYARLDAPFKPSRYIDVIKAAVAAGMEVLIIDSGTHAWKWILSYKETLDQERRSTSFQNWGRVKPLFDELKTAILESPIHIIVTMRSKSEYAVEQITTSRGDTKSEVRKLGTAAVMEPDAEYEFSVVLDINRDHMATTAGTGKDRTGLFADEPSFRISEDTGRKLKAWLGDAAPPDAPSAEWQKVEAGTNAAVVAAAEEAAEKRAAQLAPTNAVQIWLEEAFGSKEAFKAFTERCVAAEISWKKVGTNAMQDASNPFESRVATTPDSENKEYAELWLAQLIAEKSRALAPLVSEADAALIAAVQPAMPAEEPAPPTDGSAEETPEETPPIAEPAGAKRGGKK